jgi:hypothetical protein
MYPILVAIKQLHVMLAKEIYTVELVWSMMVADETCMYVQ